MARERKRKGRRVFIVNPSEPETGNFAFQQFHQMHPNSGLPEEIERGRQFLKGLRGKTVSVLVKGYSIAVKDNKVRSFSRTVDVKVNRYSDIFGSSGALVDMLKSLAKQRSPDEIDMTEIIIDEPSGDEYITEY